jgi:hypothetical protein
LNKLLIKILKKNGYYTGSWISIWRLNTLWDFLCP